MLAETMSEVEYATARLRKEIVRMGKFVADKLGVTIGDYLSDLVEAKVRADYEKHIREEAKKLNRPKD